MIELQRSSRRIKTTKRKGHGCSWYELDFRGGCDFATHATLTITETTEPQAQSKNLSDFLPESQAPSFGDEDSLAGASMYSTNSVGRRRKGRLNNFRKTLRRGSLQFKKEVVGEFLCSDEEGDSDISSEEEFPVTRTTQSAHVRSSSKMQRRPSLTLRDMFRKTPSMKLATEEQVVEPPPAPSVTPKSAPPPTRRHRFGKKGSNHPTNRYIGFRERAERNKKSEERKSLILSALDSCVDDDDDNGVCYQQSLSVPSPTPNIAGNRAA